MYDKVLNIAVQIEKQAFQQGTNLRITWCWEIFHSLLFITIENKGFAMTQQVGLLSLTTTARVQSPQNSPTICGTKNVIWTHSYFSQNLLFSPACIIPPRSIRGLELY